MSGLYIGLFAFAPMTVAVSNKLEETSSDGETTERIVFTSHKSPSRMPNEEANTNVTDPNYRTIPSGIENNELEEAVTSSTSISQNSNIGENCPISSLPYELLLNVLSYLSPSEVTHVIPLVSSYWCTLSLGLELGRTRLSYLCPKLFKKIQSSIKRGIDKDPFLHCPYIIKTHRQFSLPTREQEYYSALIIFKTLQALGYNPNTLRSKDVFMLQERFLNEHPRIIFTHETLREHYQNKAESYFQLALAGADTLEEPFREDWRTRIMKEKEAFQIIALRERKLDEKEMQKLSALLIPSQNDTFTCVYNTDNPSDEIRIAVDRLVWLVQHYDRVKPTAKEKKYKQKRFAFLAKEEIPQVYKRTKLSQEDERYLHYLLYVITEGVFKDFSDVCLLEYMSSDLSQRYSIKDLSQRHVIKDIIKYIQSYQSRQKMEHKSKQWAKVPEKPIKIVIPAANGKRRITPAVLDKPLPENNIIVDAVQHFRTQFNPIPNKNERDNYFPYRVIYPIAKNVRKDNAFFYDIPPYIVSDWTFANNQPT